MSEFILVPKELTKEMLIAGAAATRDFYSEDGPYPRTKAMWKAILSVVSELGKSAPSSTPSREQLQNLG